jgi:outer membrane protein, multidrug efflux system
MSFLRSHILWLVAVQAVGACVMAAEVPKTADVAVQAKVIDPLIAALPEQHIPGLEELLRVGLENGPTILIRRWEAEQAAQTVRIYRAPMLPQVGASLQGGMIFEQRTNEGQSDVPDRTLEALLYNVGISQNLFHWGALTKNYEVGRLYSAISSRNLEETRRLLAVDLRRRYFNLVIATGAMELARKNLSDLERDFEYAKKRVAEGFASASESGTVELLIFAAQNDLKRLTNDRDVLARDFSRLAGVPSEKLPRVVTELPPLPDLKAVMESLPEDGGGRPSVQLQNLEDYVRAEGLNYEINKTRLRPKLGLSLSVNQDDRNPDNNVLGPKALVTSWNAFATVNWTLFDGFSAQASQRAALARKRAYEADRDHVSRMDADTRKADVARLQLVWNQLKDSERTLAGARSSVGILEKDAAAGWVPGSLVDEARKAADTALQSTNTMRAEFYTALATYFSNRGIDPALEAGKR